MASEETIRKLDGLRRDLDVVTSDASFLSGLRSNAALIGPWEDAKSLALQWYERSIPRREATSEEALQPLEIFMRRLVDLGNGGGMRPNESILDAIRRVRGDFLAGLPLLSYGFLESSGIFNFSDNALQNWRQGTKDEVQSLVNRASENIGKAVEIADKELRATAVEAAADFERIKTKASEISVTSAETQFQNAHESFKRKAIVWGSLTTVLLSALVVWLYLLFTHPPALIEDVMRALALSEKPVNIQVPTSLLVVVSAYFTSIRLASAGVLGVAFAFSLRMTRAYLHMIEHNEHKLRVTRSIQAFVAAVRTDPQKDLVLAKLVESVTEFGDPGILSNQVESSGLPQGINISTGLGSHQP